MHSDLAAGSVEVILHADRPVYSVGEGVRPRLQVVNEEPVPVELVEFEFTGERLAFSGRSAAHLLGPSGRELLEPYRGPIEPRAYGAPLRVAPRRDEWLILHLSNHVDLREEGAYEFWVELLDERGRVHRSNRLRFRLEDVESPWPAETVTLSLQAPERGLPDARVVESDAVFTNRSDRPLTFLRPQEDSFDGWVNPVYRFTVKDEQGRVLPLALRSGTMSTPVYEEGARFTVPTGGSAVQRLRLPDFPGMKVPGAYRVRLTYIVRRRAIGKGGVVLDREMHWSADVFVGRLESNELTITISDRVRP